MSEWQGRSDFEINKAVAELDDVDGDIEQIIQRSAKLKCLNSAAMIKFKDIDNPVAFNPCNNPSDAWSIILENKISIFNSDNDLWSAQRWVSDKRISHEFARGKNALRAAMIVYLEMNWVKP